MSSIGKILGNRYEIIEEIGSGGMATVYKAKCKLLNRFVAIKVLRDEFANDSEFIKRFQIEAQSAASLSHQNIVSIYDVGNEDGMHYIVMELIEGKTLKEIIKEKGKLPWKEAVQIASQIASGLSQAHQNHIVHRDIKPHNIIITKEGIAKVTDFGIAKAVSNSTINAFGSTIGSVHYFSPEHARGGYTDEKSDIYSLGVVLYEMCTGRLPFEGETPVAVALKHLQEQPEEPINICNDIPQAVNDIIMKAMQKETSERYDNAGEMYKDLKRVLNNPDIEVVTEKKSNTEFPTQRIPVIGAQEHQDKVKEIEEKIKYKNEQDEENMSKKKKVTKGMALARLFIIIILVIGVFFGCIKLGEVITPLILGISQEINDEKDVLVPKLVDCSEEEAIRLLEERGLKVGEKFEVASSMPKGFVVDQQYAENYTLKKGATVNITVSKGPKTVLVPDITDFTTTNAAKAKIEAAGLVYEEKEEFSNTIPEGSIIRQEPLVNEEVAEGSTVIVYVSVGPEGEGLVQIPNVLEKNEDEARQLLIDAKLTPVITTAYMPSKGIGIVLSQTPEKDTFVSELSEVVVVVNRLPGTTIESGDGSGDDTPTPGNDTNKDNNNSNDDAPAGKRKLDIDLSNQGTRETFLVKVEIQGQSIGGKKIEYEKYHKRSDGKISVLISDIPGAFLKVYIDDKVAYEMVLN